MKTKTLVMAAVMIAATAALALAPTFTPNAMAAKGGVNPGGSTDTECVHNGNGRTAEGACTNPSGTTVITTCEKIRGKFVCTTE
jgi:hypothetical protein